MERANASCLRLQTTMMVASCSSQSLAKQGGEQKRAREGKLGKQKLLACWAFPSRAGANLCEPTLFSKQNFEHLEEREGE